MSRSDGNDIFLTWLDIERQFKRDTENHSQYPKGVESVRCYPDAAEIAFSEREPVLQWLEELFSNAWSPDETAISLAIGNIRYPVEMISSEVLIKESKPIYPLWQDQVYHISNKPPSYCADLPTELSRITAFHSFKGGVGRTTALMVYLAALLDEAKQQGVKILLVDADLEAPGITLWLEESQKPKVSYIQFLEAVHYPPGQLDDTIQYFAAELRKTSLNIEGINRELFILPASHRLTDVMDMPVLPEHLVRNLENPFQLTDHLISLGKALDVDWIFVDLRAGLSELSSPLLFDTRVEHFFVSTIAPQSVQGTAAVLEQLHQLQKNLTPDDFRLTKPTVVLGPLTAQLRQLPDYTKAAEILNASFPSGTEEVMTEGLDFAEVEFEPALMSIGSVRQAIDLTKRSTLFEKARQWAKGKLDKADRNSMSVPSKAFQDDNQESERLYELCNKLQFAESSVDEGLLVTEPLRNLAKHFTQELPNAVSVGAKGAGKTFTYLQLCRTQTWNRFLDELGFPESTLPISIIHPLLCSANLKDASPSLKIFNDARQFSLNTLNIQSDVNDPTSMVKNALKSPDTDWDDFWEKLIVKDLGYPPQETLKSINDDFNKRNLSMVLIVDGLEDIFEMPEEQKNAIKFLLQMPNRIRDLKSRRIGFICFVRADYVQAAIIQNVAQYQSRFEAFKLEWTPETFLRLVYWICAKAKIIEADTSLVDSMTVEELMDALEKLWGKKLGKDNSKEAITARWVFSAICDLNGRLQARDIVRFLKFAAKNSRTTKSDTWNDRVLSPESIRRSLGECSEEKVAEAKQEIAVFRRWAESLSKLSPELLKSPFSVETLGLDTSLLKALKELGIIYEDTDRSEKSDRFYLPEIYRSGLSFASTAGGRPRVQAFLKRNLGGMPF